MSTHLNTPAIPAPSAAVVLLRPADPKSVQRSGAQPSCGFETLLVRRNPQLRFHGGAWVFPGGRIEADELQAQARELDAARISAVRELLEETALQVAPQALSPLSCWTTPEESPRRFRAWFFMALADQAQEVQVDGGEIHGHRWMQPSAALEAAARQELELPPAVFVTLTLLQQTRELQQALALPNGEVVHYEPRSVFVPDGRVALYQRDAGYEHRALDAEGPRDRLWALKDGMRYERR